MKIYRGERTFDAIVVTVNEQPLGANRELHSFSRNHFEWGYEGDEARQLALAILADCIDGPTAKRHAEGFMREIVANFSNEWEIQEDAVVQAVSDLSTDS